MRLLLLKYSDKRSYHFPLFLTLRRDYITVVSVVSVVSVVFVMNFIKYLATLEFIVNWEEKIKGKKGQEKAYIEYSKVKINTNANRKLSINTENVQIEPFINMLSRYTNRTIFK